MNTSLNLSSSFESLNNAFIIDESLDSGLDNNNNSSFSEKSSWEISSDEFTKVSAEICENQEQMKKNVFKKLANKIIKKFNKKDKAKLNVLNEETKNIIVHTDVICNQKHQLSQIREKLKIGNTDSNKFAFAGDIFYCYI